MSSRDTGKGAAMVGDGGLNEEYGVKNGNVTAEVEKKHEKGCFLAKKLYIRSMNLKQYEI